MSGPGRGSTRRYRQAQQQFKAQCRARGARCADCGMVIDYDTTDRMNTDAFALDHIKPVATHPHLEFEPTNWLPMHARCNASKGTGALKPGLGETTRAW